MSKLLVHSPHWQVGGRFSTDIRHSRVAMGATSRLRFVSGEVPVYATIILSAKLEHQRTWCRWTPSKTPLNIQFGCSQTHLRLDSQRSKPHFFWFKAKFCLEKCGTSHLLKRRKNSPSFPFPQRVLPSSSSFPFWSSYGQRQWLQACRAQQGRRRVGAGEALWRRRNARRNGARDGRRRLMRNWNAGWFDDSGCVYLL